MASGYRPERPAKMDPDIYALVDWCWKVGQSQEGTKALRNKLKALKTLIDY